MDEKRNDNGVHAGKEEEIASLGRKERNGGKKKFCRRTARRILRCRSKSRLYMNNGDRECANRTCGSRDLNAAIFFSRVEFERRLCARPHQGFVKN